MTLLPADFDYMWDDVVREVGETPSPIPELYQQFQRRIAQQDLVHSLNLPALTPPTATGNLPSQHICYAAYGSNMCKERFMRYIEGGTPAGGHRTYPGCHDKTPPSSDCVVTIAGGLHCAGVSSVWGGGVLFFNPSQHFTRSIVRVYTISRGQFLDIVVQENAGKPGGDITREQLNLVTANLLKGVDCVKTATVWYVDVPAVYGRIVYAGTLDGNPVVTFAGTFTAADAAREAEKIHHPYRDVDSVESQTVPHCSHWVNAQNPPARGYADIVSAGLRESVPHIAGSTDVYLYGIAGWDAPQLP